MLSHKRYNFLSEYSMECRKFQLFCFQSDIPELYNDEVRVAFRPELSTMLIRLVWLLDRCRVVHGFISNVPRASHFTFPVDLLY